MRRPDSEYPDHGSLKASRGRYAGKTASRYARSFFQMMERKNRIPETHEELAWILEFSRRHPEFSRLLLATTISYEEKGDLIDQLLSRGVRLAGGGEGVSAQTRNFIKLLVKKKRFNIFEKVVESFHGLFNMDRGIEEVTFVVPHPVTEAIERRLIEVLAKKLEKKIVLTTKVDPRLIGGAIVLTRNQVIDGSFREKLKQLGRSMERQEVSC